MANPEHVAKLKEGVEAWNRWRNHQNIDLVGASLRGVDLAGIDLENANLCQVDFFSANLKRARLQCAHMDGVNCEGANLAEASLASVIARGAQFSKADLTLADLRGAALFWTNFTGADLNETCLGGASLYETILANVDLSMTNGIDACHHRGPSIVDHRTLTRSRNLPGSFLRGCGLPDTLIEYLPSLLNQPIQFYSCFISYSTKDQAFADRLHADLQNKGVRCWFAPEDLKIGDPFRQRIDEAIRLHEKLLVILSEHSVQSDWVREEVESSLEREHREKCTVLFPVRLDDAVMDTDQAWAASIRRQRHIGDFTKWKDHDAYQKALARLLRDLKAQSNIGKRGAIHASTAWPFY